MVRRLAELGLATHEPYRGVALTDAGAARRARGDPPPPPARAAPRRPRHAVGPRPRRGRGARAPHLRGARGADRRAARRPDARPARRPDPRPPTSRSTRAQSVALDALEVGARGRFVRVSDADPEMLRYLAERGIAPGADAARSSSASRSAARSSRASATRRTCSAAALARAMRVEVGAHEPRRRATRAAAPRRPAAPAGLDPETAAHARSRATCERLARARRGSRTTLARPRPGVRRVRRLRRPRQLRDEHRRRRELRLPAAVGAARREPHGDADPEPVGEARHRDRQQPARSSAASTSRAAARVGLWVQAEIVAMATDLAEFVGAAIALNLLFGIPLFPAGADHRGRLVRRARRCSAAATGASRW